MDYTACWFPVYSCLPHTGGRMYLAAILEIRSMFKGAAWMKLEKTRLYHHFYCTHQLDRLRSVKSAQILPLEWQRDVPSRSSCVCVFCVWATAFQWYDVLVNSSSLTSSLEEYFKTYFEYGSSICFIYPVHPVLLHHCHLQLLTNGCNLL